MGFLSVFASSRETKRIRSFSVLLLLLASSTAYAQPYTSRLGRFQVDQVKGCAPFTVTITRTDLTTATCTPCNMTFETGQQCPNNPSCQNQLTYTYTKAGTYTLSVLYQSVIPGSDDIPITVVENTLPKFEVYTCSGNQVSFKLTDNKYDNYDLDFENDGTKDATIDYSVDYPGNLTIQHSYPSNGNYTIRLRGHNDKAANNCKDSLQVINAVTNLLPPAITTLTAVDPTSIKLDFPKQPHMLLKSEIAVNTSPFQQYRDLYDQNTVTISSLRVDDNYYCFRLNIVDPCVIVNPNHYSSAVCSQDVNLNIESGVNKLAWNTSTSGISSTTIQRNNSPLTTIPGTPLSYNDIDIICKTNYCYQVITNYTGGAKSISLQKCGDAFTTVAPPKIDNISSIVGNPQGVELNWLVDPTITTPEFNVFRSSSGGAYQLISTTKDLKLQDAEYKTGEGTCYRINYTDACGNISPSGDPACPINLTGVLGAKNIADVSWGDYNGWINGVNHYMIEKYTTSGQLLGTVDLGTSVNYKDDPIDPVNQVIRYVIKAYANDAGVTLSSSNQIEIAKTTNLFSPTAFTPNGDNLNDNFVVIGYYISKIKLRIFDRWGALIFTTDNNEPWNGTRSGTGIPMPTGTYVWKAELTDFTGQTLSEEGTVMLVRKNN